MFSDFASANPSECEPLVGSSPPALRLLGDPEVFYEHGSSVHWNRRDEVPGQELLCGINAESTKETDEAIWDQEFSLEENRGDKDWSLTDCLSGMVMERRRLTEALTTDHHFEQTGMKALMLSLPSL
jgi:hypothetical protein